MKDIILERVTVAYSSQDAVVRVLDQLSLTIHAGEWLSVIGKNGSGKSTLARVLAGMLPTSAGSITYGALDNSQEKKSGGLDEGVTKPIPIHLVMQNPESQLIGETVEEDVRFTLELAGAAPEDIEKRLLQSLETVGLLEQRLRTTAELSGGQKQLLAVAGCLAAGAKVIVFDEASSMLDSGSRERLLAAANTLHREGVTIIWLTHAMDEVVYSDRVVALSEGRLVYEGSVLDFFYDGVEQSTCLRFGFEPPFTIQAATQLRNQGVLQGRPLKWEALQQELEVRLP